MKKHFFTPAFILYSIILPMTGLEFYCLFFKILLSRAFEKGVNFYFVNGLFYISAGLILASVSLLIIQKDAAKQLVHQFRSNYSIQRFEKKDLLLILLPMTPIIQYIFSNIDSMTVKDAAVILGGFILLSGVMIYILPMFCGRDDSKRILMLMGLAFMFTINSMALISDSFSWYLRGSFLIQFFIFLFVLIIAMVFYDVKFKFFLSALISCLFVFNSAVIITSSMTEEKTSEDMFYQNAALQYAQVRKPALKPNIYLLIYDAYASMETINAYGIDNQPQYDFLEQNGFVFYQGVYSVGATSLDSMARVLNISMEFYGNNRRAVSGDGIVQKILKENGYETYGLFAIDYFFVSIDSSYDHSYPEQESSAYKKIIPAILIGEFRFDFSFTEQKHIEFVKFKQGVFASEPVNRFIYMHTNLPSHSQNSGVCLVNEVDQYAQRIKRANLEMQQDIEIILKNDPSAILIIAGDHSPYLTKNCTGTGGKYPLSQINRLDIQDRYGTFLAIRWPDGSYQGYDKITVLQDIFPVVFAYMYKDEGFLNLKISPITQESQIVSGATVYNGIIIGGINDGEPLFISNN